MKTTTPTSTSEVQAQGRPPNGAYPQKFPPVSTKSPADPHPRSTSAKLRPNPRDDRDLRCIPAAAAASVKPHQLPQFGPNPRGIATSREVFHDHRRDRATTKDHFPQLVVASTTCWNHRLRRVASTTSTRPVLAPVPQSTTNMKSMKSTTSTRRRLRLRAVSTIASGNEIASTQVASMRRLARSMRRFPIVGGTDHHPQLDPAGIAIGTLPPAAVAVAAPSIKSTSTRSFPSKVVSTV